MIVSFYLTTISPLSEQNGAIGNSQNLLFKLTIKDVKNPTATINIGFYKREDKFPDLKRSSIFKSIIPGKKGDINLVWDDIPQGEYALAVYQDLDNNGKLNSSIFGMPKEPYGFSLNFVPVLRAPKFGECKIDFNSNSNAFEIKLNN